MIGKDLDAIGSVSSADLYHYSALTDHRDGGCRHLSNGQDLVGPEFVSRRLLVTRLQIYNVPLPQVKLMITYPLTSILILYSRPFAYVTSHGNGQTSIRVSTKVNAPGQHSYRNVSDEALFLPSIG